MIGNHIVIVQKCDYIIVNHFHCQHVFYSPPTTQHDWSMYSPVLIHVFLSPWPLTDSYQYQLQSMWQKCWNTNHNMVHQLRFRERGPLKSWRPETMAEAIFSVLKEGLSLSQAARKYDIPYPTFVLYANRVHNMLGPSMDGGTDLRPKGRGRPQRILLGLWPDDHIRGVIKTVVFRDGKDMKEDGGYNSQSVC